jgi:hypothetical protein
MQIDIKTPQPCLTILCYSPKAFCILQQEEDSETMLDR